MKKISISLISIVLLLPLLVSAQTPLQTVPSANINDIGGVLGVINTIGNWMFSILLALAVIFIIYAAFLYLTAAGNADKMEQAKTIIVYAIVAIVVAVLAKGIILVAAKLVGQTVNV